MNQIRPDCWAIRSPNRSAGDLFLSASCSILQISCTFRRMLDSVAVEFTMKTRTTLTRAPRTWRESFHSWMCLSFKS